MACGRSSESNDDRSSQVFHARCYAAGVQICVITKCRLACFKSDQPVLVINQSSGAHRAPGVIGEMRLPGARSHSCPEGRLHSRLERLGRG
jgi:hypothetical protein